MKRKCKKINIADKAYIKKCIERCMKKKSSKAWRRSDVSEYWAKHDGQIDSIVDELHDELMTRTVNYPPSKHKIKVDPSNGKTRDITVDHIKLQYYNYIANDALDDLTSRIGEYQLAFLEGKGCIFGARVIKGWLQSDTSIRYAIKADIKKCYPSITHENMMNWLNRHVSNDLLLYLISEILKCVDEGLPIGSYLSIRLCGLYLADLYHHIGECYYKTRRGKRVNVVKHVMFFLDDIYIFGSNARDMHQMMEGVTVYAAERGLTIKPSWQLINLNPNDERCHIDAMGYRIYRDRITMRRRNYQKTKKALHQFRANPSVRNARALSAYHGLFIKTTDSLRFKKKYEMKKYFRKARRVISHYDKGDFLSETAARNNHKDHGGHQSVSDLSERVRSDF